VACAIGPSDTTSSTNFFGIYLNFEWYKSFINQYLPHFESKSYHINFIKLYSSRSFQQHQRHILIPPKFLVIIYFLLKKSLNIKKLLHWKSKCHGIKPMHPYWHAPKFLVRPKMGRGYSNNKIVKNSGHAPSS